MSAWNLRSCALPAALWMLSGCGASYDTPSGKDEPITVEYPQSVSSKNVTLPAQFFPGEIEAGSGPELFALKAKNHLATAGGSLRTVVGDAAPDAYTVAVRLKDVGTGYWLVKVNVPDPNLPPNNTFAAIIHFAEHAPLGDQTVLFAARNRAGVFGPITETPFTLLPPVPVDADTVVSLVWDTHADLDLHIRAPGGKELDPAHPNTVTLPPGYKTETSDPIPGNGVLDHDANENCTYDGVIRENVVFDTAPVPGLYQFYVDEFSSCGVAATTFRLEIYHQGTLAESFTGQLLDVNADGGASSGIFIAERTF